MLRLAPASLIGIAALAAAPPLLAQTTPVRPASQQPGVISQSISVPVFPGQLIGATVTMPVSEATPLPAVLLLTVRAPGSAPAPASLAMANALLARGIAVVRLDLPPVPAGTPTDAEPLLQPADDAFAVLQFVREREDIDGDRVAIVGVGDAAEHAARAAGMDEAVRALVLLGARPVSADTMDLPIGLPLMALPFETRAAPADADPRVSPVVDAAAFLSRHLQ